MGGGVNGEDMLLDGWTAECYCYGLMAGWYGEGAAPLLGGIPQLSKVIL